MLWVKGASSHSKYRESVPSSADEKRYKIPQVSMILPTKILYLCYVVIVPTSQQIEQYKKIKC